MSDENDKARRIIRRDVKATKAQQDQFKLANPLGEAAKQLFGPSDELRKTLNRISVPDTGIAKSIQALTGPHQEWLRMADQWKAMSTRISPVVDLNVGRGWMEAIKAFSTPFANLAAALKPLFDEFDRHEAVCQSLERVGWLPHYTTPFDELDGLADNEVEEVLHRHYVEGWANIRAAILAQLETYKLDFVAKAAFVEALDGYEAGRYRSTVALLFIEIERLVRTQLHGGALDGISSVKSLQKLAGQMSLHTIEPGGAAGLRLYKKLIKHLYGQVKTPEALAICDADPVPNRHAAVHGLIVYDTRQNCLNALFMADYIFQVMSIGRTAEAS